ncbi:hypothetical protein NKG94_13240 [Micromonospora sp. M12]
MTFINLPVRDLTTAVEFYLALGFTSDQAEPDGAARCSPSPTALG